ncbi:MAG: hypothetical protein PHV34_20090 [Verrucomicrobiae bacterium]|nr:hypothetical protein [Verrucomicrobiae bacterium]
MIELAEKRMESFFLSRQGIRLKDELRVVAWSELKPHIDVFEGTGEVRTGLICRNNPINLSDLFGLRGEVEKSMKNGGMSIEGLMKMIKAIEDKISLIEAKLLDQCLSESTRNALLLQKQKLLGVLARLTQMLNRMCGGLLGFLGLFGLAFDVGDAAGQAAAPTMDDIWSQRNAAVENTAGM